MSVTSNRGWLVFCLSAAVVAAGGRAVGDSIDASTRPNRDVYLSFTRPGQIAEVLVKDGQRVEKDQVLVRMDDEVERIRVESLKAEADNQVYVEAAEASLDQKRVELELIQYAADRHAATKLEVRQATVNVLIAKLTLKQRTLEQRLKVREYEGAKAQLERMRLKSPIDGVVEALPVEKGRAPSAGETVDTNQPVIRVVNIEPLLVDVAVPLAQASKLRVGQTARVRWVYGAGDEKAEAKIVHKAAVAEGGSNTLTVRLECPNPNRRPAREPVEVTFAAGGANDKDTPRAKAPEAEDPTIPTVVVTETNK